VDVFQSYGMASPCGCYNVLRAKPSGFQKASLAFSIGIVTCVSKLIDFILFDARPSQKRMLDFRNLRIEHPLSNSSDHPLNRIKRLCVNSNQTSTITHRRERFKDSLSATVADSECLI